MPFLPSKKKKLSNADLYILNAVFSTKSWFSVCLQHPRLSRQCKSCPILTLTFLTLDFHNYRLINESSCSISWWRKCEGCTPDLINSGLRSDSFSTKVSRKQQVLQDLMKAKIKLKDSFHLKVFNKRLHTIIAHFVCRQLYIQNFSTRWPVCHLWLQCVVGGW